MCDYTSHEHLRDNSEWTKDLGRRTGSQEHEKVFDSHPAYTIRIQKEAPGP